MKPYRVVFLTLPDFTLLAATAAIEVMRMANRMLGESAYEWAIEAANPDLDTASCGLTLCNNLANFGPLEQSNLVLVCGGIQAERWLAEPLMARLRDLNRRKVALGGLCTGSMALAKAGVLDGYRATVHWENLNALRELFPAINLSEELFVIDRDRYTCGGGVASLDMMLSLVGEHFGHEVVGQISEVFSLDRIRPENHPQLVPLRAKVGLTHENLIEAATLMGANLEEPLPMDEVARLVGVSRRQIERLFKKHVGMAPTKYYLDLRLQKARELLQQTSMSVMEISIACGFVSNPHFSHCYRKLFGHAPSAERLAPALQDKPSDQAIGSIHLGNGAAAAPTFGVSSGTLVQPGPTGQPPSAWLTHTRQHPPLYQWQQSFWTRQAQDQHELLGA